MGPKPRTEAVAVAHHWEERLDNETVPDDADGNPFMEVSIHDLRIAVDFMLRHEVTLTHRRLRRKQRRLAGGKW